MTLEFIHSPIEVVDQFPPVRDELCLSAIDDGLLITQAKWEANDFRISSCYPTAILNGAILAGALEPDVAHTVHDRLLALPSNWIRTSHPDARIAPIQGFRLQTPLQKAQEFTVAHLLYQIYGVEDAPMAFGVRQLFHGDLDRVIDDGRKLSVSHELIRAVLKRNVVVSGFKQHAVTIVRDGDNYIEINPRHPHDPTPVTAEKLGRTWARKTGLASTRRLLEAIVGVGPVIK